MANQDAVALKSEQNQSSKSAPRKAVLRFPQAIAGIWKPDARNGFKIQDIVVCC
jgi:hypothetical protein